jgi:hypothetical protein
MGGDARLGVEQCESAASFRSAHNMQLICEPT